MTDDAGRYRRLNQREVAEAYDVPPWRIGPDIQRTRREVLRWRLRWIPKARRRGLRVLDKTLPKIGLMRTSQQMVKKITVDEEGRLSVTLRNGFRWSGRHEYGFMEKLMVPSNPIFEEETSTDG